MRLLILVVMLSMASSCTNEKSEKVLKLWNQGDKNEAASSAKHFCLEKDAKSCYLYSLPIVEEHHLNNGQKPITLETIKSMFPGNQVFELKSLSFKLIGSEYSTAEKIDTLKKINNIEDKYFLSNKLFSIRVFLKFFATDIPKDNIELLKVNEKITSALINRNFKSGISDKAFQELKNGNYTEAFNLHEKLALHGETRSIRMIVASYALGKGRLKDHNKSKAWLEICKMLDEKGCSKQDIIDFENIYTDDLDYKKINNITQKLSKTILSNIEVAKDCNANIKIFCNEDICDQYCSVEDYSEGRY